MKSSAQIKRASFILFFMAVLFSALPVYPASLFIDPSSPFVQVGGQITLCVTNASGEVRWSAFDGEIEQTGNPVVYKAPDRVAIDALTAKDSAGNTGTVTVVVQEKEAISERFSKDNANWEIFTNRDNIQALLLSDDGATLWMGTEGGLEQRDAFSGRLQKVYSNKSGLPDNHVTSLVSDNQGGLWAGTYGGGAGHLESDGTWKVFNKKDYGLPDNRINSIISDSKGGIWIGHETGGLSHLKADGILEIFNKGNSGLPSDYVASLLLDGQGGIWAGTWGGGLAHLQSDGTWKIFNTDNSDLPDNDINALVSDNQGGIWLGIGYYTGFGLGHLGSDCDLKIFNKDNSGLPDNRVVSLLSDSKGDIWAGTMAGGLACLQSDGIWEIFNTGNSDLPDNDINALVSDNQGGILVGTGAGVRHLKKDGTWDMFNAEDSGLPDNDINTLVSDGQGGVWAGSGKGLVHRKSDGKWEIFNTDNSDLPDNVVTALVSDNQGGLWVGGGYYGSGGLGHRKSDGKWEIFNTDNSDLPDNVVTALVSDNQGGLWVGTRGGLGHLESDHISDILDKNNSYLPANWITALASDNQGEIWMGIGYNSIVALGHIKSDGSLNIFDETNSCLEPDSDITSLLSDGKGGIWVGTWGNGLVHRKSDGTWEAINMGTQSDGLPSDYVNSIFSDTQGGIWVGTEDKGLGHLKSDGIWDKFDENNSGLKSNNAISSLLSDGACGLWVGTNGGGLARLTFSSLQIQEEQYLTGGCAAIIIAGGGNTDTNLLWDSTARISNYIYKVLNRRNFLNTDIYYISPQPFADFNGDGFDDKIVDAPNMDSALTPRQLQTSDIRDAFDWAKTKGKLNQPLYLFFTDHGGIDRLQLSQGVYIEAAELKTMLDDYQQSTGNSVIVVIDACHSGSMVKALAKENRSVISSTDDGLAYFDRTEDQSFSWFVAKGLSKGMNFLETFHYAVSEQKVLLGKLSAYNMVAAGEAGSFVQAPQYDDTGDGIYTIFDDGSWLKQFSVNGTFTDADITLSVKPVTDSGVVSSLNQVTLKAEASLASGTLRRVWAVIRPPQMDILVDDTGVPLLAFPKAALGRSDTGAENIYEGSWNGFVYNGEYEITFYAEDNDKNIESSESIILTVADGLTCPERGFLKVVSGKQPDSSGTIVYQSGDTLNLSVTENLAYGYDLYVVLLMPDGNFTALKKSLTDSNQLQKDNFNKLYRGDRWIETNKNINMGRAVDAINLALPQEKLQSGSYCLYAAFIPEGQELLNAVGKGLFVLDGVCFEIVKN